MGLPIMHLSPIRSLLQNTVSHYQYMMMIYTKNFTQSQKARQCFHLEAPVENDWIYCRVRGRHSLFLLGQECPQAFQTYVVSHKNSLLYVFGMLLVPAPWSDSDGVNAKTCGSTPALTFGEKTQGRRGKNHRKAAHRVVLKRPTLFTDLDL